jgi:hypothetical protein
MTALEAGAADLAQNGCHVRAHRGEQLGQAICDAGWVIQACGFSSNATSFAPSMTVTGRVCRWVAQPLPKLD